MKSRKKIIGLVVLMTTAIYVAYAAWPRPVPPEVLQEPNEILTSVSEEVTTFDEQTKQIAEELKTVIKKADFHSHIFGLGLAAPQLGYSQRIIALKSSYGNYQILVNPKIVKQQWHLPWTEKCMSLEGRHFLKRYFWVKVQYQDIEGNDFEETIMGPRAAVLQQEIDHVNQRLLATFHS